MDDLHYAMQDFHRLTEANDALQAQVEQRDAEIAALREALNAMLSEFNEAMTGIVHDELAAIAKARQALRGEGSHD